MKQVIKFNMQRITLKKFYPQNSMPEDLANVISWSEDFVKLDKLSWAIQHLERISEIIMPKHP